MQFENRPIPEGINVSDENPLVDFIWMLLTVGFIIGVLVVVLAVSAGWLAKNIPFSQEQRWAETFVQDAKEGMTVESHRIEEWLQALADSLAGKMELEPGMRIRVHYVENDDIVNAYATLGGHVVVYSGLLKVLDSENAVAMVLAHEIAHIKHRDPVVALGRGIAVVLGLSTLGGVSDTAFANQVVGNVGLLTGLSFSRAQENEADEQAVVALRQYYGHLNGAAALFEYLERQQMTLVPEILNSHPLTEKRINRIKSAVAHTDQGPVTALPVWLPNQ